MKIKSYLGIDIGSSSLKIAIIDEGKNLLDAIYLRNEGLISTTQKGLEQIANKDYDIKGCCVTGSGRKFLGLLVGADEIRTEILAHAVAGLHYYPKIGTLIDIGAEDNKAIFFNDGMITDFVMNNICAGGCGQTLEMIANKLSTRIEDVGKLALKSTKRLNISSKCGVFMNSMVVSHRNSGQKNEDILMGTIRGIVRNYLTMIQGMNTPPLYVFQSASAKNEAFVQAFEEALKHKVIVPEYCDVMGAIGASFLAQMEEPKQTKFKGFQIADRDYRTKTITAKGCDNRCEITFLYDSDKYIGALGNRCDKCVKK